MSENYQLVYQSRRKCEIYRDTGVSKNYKSKFFSEAQAFGSLGISRSLLRLAPISIASIEIMKA